MPQNLTGVENSTEPLTFVFISPMIIPKTDQSRRSNPRHFGHHRHQITRQFELILVDHRVILGIYASVDPMHQSIPLSISRISEIRHRADGIATRHKINFDGVVKSPTTQRFQSASIREKTPNPGPLALQSLAFPGGYVKSPARISYVHPAIRSHKRTTQNGSVVVKDPARQDHFFLIRYAIPI